MKLSLFGRTALATVVSLALGLGITACGSGTIGYMYVLGAQGASNTAGNAITSYKIDDRTGNLTAIVGSPFSSGGVNPVNAIVLLGGRFLFVLNAGNSTTPGNVSEFSIGGDGILTFQENFYSQGTNPLWIGQDSTGQYLYILDQNGPAPYNNAGEITVYFVNGTTGRVTLVVNQQVKTSAGTQLPFFPVGVNPIMMKLGSGCIYVLEHGSGALGQNVYPLQVGTAGQLVVTTNGQYSLSTLNATSITGDSGGRYIYITDAGTTSAPNNNVIYPYTQNTGCSLSPLVGGAVTQTSLSSNPVWTLTSNNGKFLYVLNQGNLANPLLTASNITAYTLDPSTGQLTLITDSPYSSGSGPVCMVEDPTNQYLFVSNHYDSTVDGYIINLNTGQLSPLTHKTSFPVTGLSTCLVISQYTS